MSGYKIIDVEDLRLFAPHEDEFHVHIPLTQAADKANAEFLETFTPVEPAKSISGSFIYAHAPDYYGMPTLHFSEADWRALFQDMKASGIDTVIFQASIWNELGECYYESKYFSRLYKSWRVVEPMLAAAQAERMAVFLGGYGSVVGWQKCLTPEIVKREVEKQVICIKELLECGGLFQGIYFSSETAFDGEPFNERGELLNRLYREYFGELKKLAPDKKIAMSPATMFRDQAQWGANMRDYWVRLLDGVPLDILMPQDSIGTTACQMRFTDAAFRVWSETCSALGIHLWAHLEIFQRVSYELRRREDIPFIPASPRRVRAQQSNLSPYVEKLVCWEYPYFTAPSSGAEAIQLREGVFQ